jgi:hypothetical protein
MAPLAEAGRILRGASKERRKKGREFGDKPRDCDN